MNILSPGLTRTVDLASHLGVMACECELEAAMYPPLDWYAEFLRDLARAYRNSQFDLLERTYTGRTVALAGFAR